MTKTLNNKWREVKAGDILEVLTDYHANGSYEKLKENVTLLDEPDYAIMIRTTNFENNDFEKNLRYVNEHAYEFLSKSKVFPGDILMNKIANAGSVYIMPHLNKPVSLAMNLFLLRFKRDIVNQIYIYYYLKANEKYIKLFAIGAAATTITKENVRNLKVRLPSRSTQDKISYILSSYDYLIENNNHRIKILEEMSQTIYSEWFVKFHFPGHSKAKMVKSELGDIPEGWNVKQLNDIIDIRSGFAFKSGTFTHEAKYGLVTIRNVQDGDFVTECDSRFQDIPEKMPEYCLLKEGDILLSLTGNVGRVCLCYGDDYLLNQRVAKLVPKEETNWAYIYFMYFQPQFRTKLEMISIGVAQQNLSPVEMGKIKIVYPTEVIRKSYAGICNTILQDILVLFQKNKVLRQTRDLLLPRFISGELDVEGLDIKVDN